MVCESLSSRILELNADNLPDDLYRMAETCLLDLLGVAIAASETSLAGIGRQFVLSQYPGDQPLLFCEGSASSIGSALYGGWLIDALDGHDGHVLTKGHAGVALLPAFLALPECGRLSGRRFLGELAIGYEVAIRAGISLHASACDYHTSGAWNCLGVAAMAARLKQLNADQLDHALGIAEFYGPRSQMMRCIDYPTMLKDGSGWGAMTGLSAAMLAQSGFTGAPALLLGEEAGANEAVEAAWRNFGDQWHFRQTYFKRFPVCYWAQPAVEATLSLMDQLTDPRHIDHIDITTFHQAKRLHTTMPHNTEQAQYSLPWAVACALHGQTIDQHSVTTDLLNPDIQRLARSVTVTENETFNLAFPARRFARVTLCLSNGTELVSKDFEARGTPHQPLSEPEMVEKFRQLSQPAIGSQSEAIIKTVKTLRNRPASDLLNLLGPVPAMNHSRTATHPLETNHASSS